MQNVIMLSVFMQSLIMLIVANITLILSVIMLSVIYTECGKYKPYADCYYAECHLC